MLDLLEDQGPGSADVRARARREPPRAAMGYRRHAVRAQLPGRWSIRIPGSLHEELDDNGTYCAWGGGRTVWFSSFTFSGQRATTLDDLRAKLPPDAVKIFERDEGGILGAAGLRRHVEDGRAGWLLTFETAVSGHLGIATISFDADEDLDWALASWRSLRPPAASG